MNTPVSSILYIIDVVNNLPEEVIKEHATELCHMLSNILDDHNELIAGVDALLDKLQKHRIEVAELMNDAAKEHGRTATEQFQVFADELLEQKNQHLLLEELIASIFTHLTTDELAHIKENTVERREIHGTVDAIMEKYEELMEKG